MKRPTKKRGRRNYAPRKRKQKTFEQICELSGTEFDLNIDTGVVLSLEDKELKHATFTELLAKFYRLNYRQSPLAFVLIEDMGQAIREKIWQIVMRGNFYMDIEKGPDSSGPHRVRLWFRTFRKPNVNYWLASYQAMGFFFNEVEMKQQVKQATDKKEFFMLPQNAEVIIQP